MSSRFLMMSKWHMGFTDQTNVETTLRKAILCASNQLQSNVSTSNSVTKILPVVVRNDSIQEDPQVLELRPKILAKGVEVDEARWWSIPMPAVFSNFGASPCCSRSVCFINLSICVSRLLFFPAILISSTDRNSPCCRFKHEHSHSGTFLHPFSVETSSNCHFQSNPAKGCPMLRGWYIAKGQCSSLYEGAVVLTLGSVDIEDGVQGKVQVECGREEVNNGENQEKDRTKTDNAETHIMGGSS